MSKKSLQHRFPFLRFIEATGEGGGCASGDSGAVVEETGTVTGPATEPVTEPAPKVDKVTVPAVEPTSGPFHDDSNVNAAMQVELEKALADAAASKAALMRFQIAAKYGLTGDHVETLLTSTDEATLTKQAEAVAALSKPATAGWKSLPVVKGCGTNPPPAKPNDAQQFITEPGIIPLAGSTSAR